MVAFDEIPINSTPEAAVRTTMFRGTILVLGLFTLQLVVTHDPFHELYTAR